MRLGRDSGRRITDVELESAPRWKPRAHRYRRSSSNPLPHSGPSPVAPQSVLMHWLRKTGTIWQTLENFFRALFRANTSSPSSNYRFRNFRNFQIFALPHSSKTKQMNQSAKKSTIFPNYVYTFESERKWPKIWNFWILQNSSKTC